ncbi:sensor histidine kinase [Streptomyces sp. NBC_01538]|uniref:sensor histidine kinase n=1 Tax=Streptomyces sp. NBC_01538 TaxID=2903897 RepID=UPI003869FA42
MPSLDRLRIRLPGDAHADAALAGGVFALVALGAEGQRLGHGEDSMPSVITSWLLITAVCGALLSRRRYPVAVGWFTVLGTGAYYLLSETDGPLVVVPVVALYAIAAQGRLRAAIAMAAAMVIGILAGILAGSGDVNGTAVFMLTGWLVAVVALGSVRHGRVAYAEEEARLRATEERLRIARELHDVIGHNVSMINVQAAAALHRLAKDPAPEKEPVAQAGAALRAIKEGSREVLRELRATLDVLRRVDEDAPTAPAPGLARADELVASAKLAGVAVRIERTGAVRPLPAQVDLAAYRIVQESLTNAVRHSRSTRVTIRLAYGDRELTLAVEDDGVGAAALPAGPGGGSGIAGMTERARVLGGRLTAGPRPEGGFEVRARLPYGTTYGISRVDEATGEPTEWSDR